MRSGEFEQSLPQALPEERRMPGSQHGLLAGHEKHTGGKRILPAFAAAQLPGRLALVPMGIDLQEPEIAGCLPCRDGGREKEQVKGGLQSSGGPAGALPADPCEERGKMADHVGQQEEKHVLLGGEVLIKAAPGDPRTPHDPVDTGIRIRTFTSVSRNLLPKLMKRFKSKYPGLISRRSRESTLASPSGFRRAAWTLDS